MTSTSRLCTSALAAAAWMLFADPAVAADVSCPPAIDETPSVAQRDGAWTVVALPGERPLERVGVYLGTPAEPGAQVPDTTRKNRSHEVLTWNLPAPHGGTFWAGCHYVGTTALLLQALPPQARRCVATWDLLPSGRRQRLAAFRCD